MESERATVNGSALVRLASLIEAKQWDDAWTEFEHLRKGSGSAHLYLMGSYVAHGRRDLYAARLLADQALAALTPADPVKLLGQIRFHLGLVAREVGDTSVALKQFECFLSELPEKYPELSMAEGKAHFYRGLTLQQRRDFDDALVAYQYAASAFRRDGLPGLLCRTQQNAAWLMCQMNRNVEAWVALCESAPLATDYADQIHQTLGEAYLYAIEGDHGVVAALCESIWRRAEQGEAIDAEMRAQAAWIAGMVAMDQQLLDSAAALAQAALHHAEQTRDARLINDANALSAEIAQRAGR